MYDNPDCQALLGAVRATPDADLPRLVLADWLDDHGDPGWAELIRVDCESFGLLRTCGVTGEPVTGVPDEGDLPGCDCRPCRVARRGFELYVDQIEEICGPIDRIAGPDRILTSHKRGFVHTLRLTAADVRHLPAVVRLPRCCVTRVRLTDRWPERFPDAVTASWAHEGNAGNSDDDPLSALPDMVFRRLSGGELVRDPVERLTWRRYSSERAAEDDLSAALLAWAWDQPC